MSKRRAFSLVHQFTLRPVLDFVIGAGPEPITTTVANEVIDDSIIDDCRIIEDERPIGTAAKANELYAVVIAVSRSPFVKNRLRCWVIVVVSR